MNQSNNNSWLNNKGVRLNVYIAANDDDRGDVAYKDIDWLTILTPISAAS